MVTVVVSDEVVIELVFVLSLVPEVVLLVPCVVLELV